LPKRKSEIFQRRNIVFNISENIENHIQKRKEGIIKERSDRMGDYYERSEE